MTVVDENVKPVAKRITDAQFVSAYVRCEDAEALAALTGLSESTVKARIGKLKKAGVNIKQYDRKPKEIDVNGLNALIPSEPEAAS
jgi:DNA-binding Lrp family transcriptional regulator